MACLGRLGSIVLLGALAGCGMQVSGDEADKLTGDDVDTKSQALGGQRKRKRLYTPPPNPEALRQIKNLQKRGRRIDAARVQEMIETPQAV